MKNTSRLVQAGVALALTAGLAAGAQASVPSPLNGGYGTIGAPGNAFATGGATISLSGSGNSYSFTYSGSPSTALEFVSPNSTFSVSGAAISMTGTLTRSGSNPWTLSSGTETITGNIASCSGSCGSLSGWSSGSGVLFKANLTSLQAFTPSGGYDYLGFKTNFTGTSSWMLTNNINQGSNNESVYLYALGSSALSTTLANNANFNSLVALLASGGNLGTGTINAYVGSYSTVPLPLSGLLLTGGLAGLGLFARRKIGVVG